MSGMWGMDLEQGARLARQFSIEANRLESIQRQVGLLMFATGWLGRDWEFFREDWGHRLSPQMTRTVAALRERSEVLSEQVAEQREASRAVVATGHTSTAKRSVQPDGFGEWLRDGVESAGRTLDSAGRTAWGLLISTPAVRSVLETYERLEATHTALGRFVDVNVRAVGRNAEILLSGRVPTLSELAAQQVVIAGSAAGVAANYLAGKDLRIMDDGSVGTITERSMAVKEVGSIADLTDLTMSSYNENGVIITMTAEGHYIVSIAGTQGELGDPQSYTGSSRANDWQANLHSMAFGTSSYGEAIVEIIRKKVPAGSRILITGHSQGGSQAVTIASNPALHGVYEIDGVIAYGAPVDHAAVPSKIPVLSVEHRSPTNSGDLVPLLDLEGVNALGRVRTSPNVTKLELDPPANPGDFFGNHQQDSYSNGMRNMNSQQESMVRQFSIAAGLENYYGTPESQTAFTPQRQ